jgi:alpha-maltose-1-phosphate synthase
MHAAQLAQQTSRSEANRMTRSLDFALSTTEDAYSAPGRAMIGRRVAGDGFLAAAARAVGTGEIVGYGAIGEEAAFRERVAQANPSAIPRFLDATRPDRLASVGALFVPGPDIAEPAWRRSRHLPGGWSLMGITHSLAGAVAMDALCACAGGAVEEYDAIICTSRAARAVAERVFDAKEEHLRRRLGATRFVRPRLPVIPLGVDVEAFRSTPARRAAVRATLGLREEDVAVLSVGRIDQKTKAHHLPLLVAAARAGLNTVLVLAGAAENEQAIATVRAAALRIAPQLRIEIIANPENEHLRGLYAACDVFVSLSDNIQETFGLAVLEAMASGLPCIVSDWDGYRDTVREGVDGLRVPTLIPPPSMGEHLADLHDARAIGYRDYAGSAAALTVVDVDAAARSIALLAGDARMRRNLGAAARERAVAEYDWSAIVARYRDLAGELADSRRQAGSSLPPRAASPARLSPFETFAGHPSAILTSRTLVAIRDAALLEAALRDESAGLRAMSAAAKLVTAQMGTEAMPLGALLDVPRDAAGSRERLRSGTCEGRRALPLDP